MAYRVKAYHHQRKCIKIKKNGENCKAIALVGSEYCRMHSRLTPLQRLQKKEERALGINSINKARYNPKQVTVRDAYNANLQSPTLLNLHDEVALLQARLQELLASPVSKIELQLQVVDRIERLITSIKKIELTSQALKQAENKVTLVINKVALIINNAVKDRAVKQAIAKELYKLGVASASKQESASINTETPSINKPNVLLRENVLLLEGAEGEIGGRGSGTGKGSQIPTLPQSSNLPTPAQSNPLPNSESQNISKPKLEIPKVLRTDTGLSVFITESEVRVIKDKFIIDKKATPLPDAREFIK